MFYPLPLHLSFSLAGFQTAATIKNLQSDDITLLENFARTIPALIDTVAYNKNIKIPEEELDHIYKDFLGTYDDYPDRFCFGKGARSHIMQIVHFVNSVIEKGPNETENYSYFNPTEAATTTWTKFTSVGRIFDKTSMIACKSIDTVKLIKPLAPLSAQQFQVIKHVLEEALLKQVKITMAQFFEENNLSERNLLNRLYTMDDLPLNMVSVNSKDLRWWISSLNDYEDDAANRTVTVRSIRGKICCHCTYKCAASRASHRNCNASITVSLRPSKGLEEFVTVVHFETMEKNFNVTYYDSARDNGTWQCANFRRHLQKHKPTSNSIRE